MCRYLLCHLCGQASSCWAGQIRQGSGMVTCFLNKRIHCLDIQLGVLKHVGAARKQDQFCVWCSVVGRGYKVRHDVIVLSMHQQHSLVTTSRSSIRSQFRSEPRTERNGPNILEKHSNHPMHHAVSRARDGVRRHVGASTMSAAWCSGCRWE